MYNPGVQPIGGQLIGQGITEAGRALGSALQIRGERKRQDATEAQQQAEMAKKVAEMTRGMRTVAKNLPGLTKEQVEAMGYNELGTVLQNYSLMSAAEQQKAQRQRQAEMAAAVRKFLPGPGEQGPLPSAEQVNRYLLQEPGFVDNIDPNMVMSMLPKEQQQPSFMKGPGGVDIMVNPGGTGTVLPQPGKESLLEEEKYFNAIQQAKKEGNYAKAEMLEQGFLKKVTPSGFSSKLEYDDQGRPVVTFGTGPQGASAPTLSERSKIQEQQRKGEESLNMLDKLQASLTPQSLGVRGKLGEVVVDRGLAQLVPGVGNKDRMSARDLIRVTREQLLRQVSGDTRFSNTDRSQIESLLVSEGAMESYDSAMSKINQVREMLQDRLKIGQKAMEGTPTTGKPTMRYNPETGTVESIR